MRVLLVLPEEGPVVGETVESLGPHVAPGPGKGGFRGLDSLGCLHGCQALLLDRPPLHVGDLFGAPGAELDIALAERDKDLLAHLERSGMSVRHSDVFELLADARRRQHQGVARPDRPHQERQEGRDSGLTP
jgi:hypothetical protein